MGGLSFSSVIITVTSVSPERDGTPLSVTRTVKTYSSSDSLSIEPITLIVPLLGSTANNVVLAVLGRE